MGKDRGADQTIRGQVRHVSLEEQTRIRAEVVAWLKELRDDRCEGRLEMQHSLTRLQSGQVTQVLLDCIDDEAITTLLIIFRGWRRKQFRE